jgi:hypothetical protein
MLASLFTDDFVRNIINCTRVENVSLCLVVVQSLSKERAEIQSTTVLTHLQSAANERFFDWINVLDTVKSGHTDTD